jgi:hypothetical protein
VKQSSCILRQNNSPLKQATMKSFMISEFIVALEFTLFTIYGMGIHRMGTSDLSFG